MQLTKLSTIVIAMCTVCGCITHFCQKQLEQSLYKRLEQFGRRHQDTGPVRKNDELGTLFYARQTIPRGSMINIAFVSSQQVERKRIPMDAVQRFEQMANCVSRHDIVKGEIISTRELLPVRFANDLNNVR
ncbi:hypothetical protein KF728_16875 [Candidatus Obscuribacterales bacterium]|nr:hypothetical protein [Candidatus Obscuribacterales bacterium]